MICCLCGEAIDPAVDTVLRLTQLRPMENKITGTYKLVEIPLEDGSKEKYMHPVCPVMFGAPLALVGADRRPDV